MSNISLSTILGGEAINQFDLKLGEVMKNILDVTTPAKATRKVILELTLKPNENDREAINFSVNVKTSPSAPIPLEGRMFAGVTSKGEVVYSEDNPRQRSLFDEPAPEAQETEQPKNVTPLRKDAAKL